MWAVDFLAHRGWAFWTAIILGGVVTGVCLAQFPGDLAAERAARRLQGAEPMVAGQVLWRVADRTIKDIAVVVPGPGGGDFTVDLVAAPDADEVDAFDGWQPAGAGPAGFVPPLRVRVDFDEPVAMREEEVREYASRWRSAADVLLAGCGVLSIVAAVGLGIRDERRLAPPKRRQARRRTVRS